MREGQLIANRYRLDSLIRRGGMGRVYRGRDVEAGRPVSVKLELRGHGDADLGARLDREAHALSLVRHPGVVAYLDHGKTERGQPYLVMEWLDGEDLESVLSRRALGVAETVRLGIRLCDSLRAVHAHGIVHRDIKPANIFLVGGDVDQAKLLDFGLAYQTGQDGGPPTFGSVVGTPSFMAPEQARGADSIDTRADLYSLGAVLFACLTQRPPFTGEHAIAVLAKVLYDDPARPGDLRDDVPAELDQLIATLLDKQPERRASRADQPAATLAAVLEQLGGRATLAMTAAEIPAVTRWEQRYSTVLFVAGKTLERDAAVHQALDDYAATYGAQLDVLASGTIAGVFAAGGKPDDIAVRAAQCAQAISVGLALGPVVLCTGRSVAHQRLPVGRMIDRAVMLLMASTAQQATEAAPGVSLDVAVIVDHVTASFLDRRFDIVPMTRVAGERRYALRGMHSASPRAPHLLLGRTTQLVDREREIAVLDALASECLDQQVARCVLITGANGTGKTRLCHELLHRIDARAAGAVVWTGRGDWLRSGASLGLLAEVIRDAMGFTDRQSDDERVRIITERVNARVAIEDATRVAEFVGEILGAPFGDRDRMQLRAARQDPKLMHDQMQRAFLDWLDGEAAGGPIVIVLDDLHWGDRPTIRFIETAVRSLAERPILVVALARPDVHELFPSLFTGSAFETLTLHPLPPRACRQLVDQVIDVADEVAEELIAHSEGNAFYLEELIRNIAAQAPPGQAMLPRPRRARLAVGARPIRLPETVLAMAEARLGALPAEERRVLRAASVFGHTFWWGGVAALLGPDMRDFELDMHLESLVERELVVAQRSSRFVGENEYLFRHDLVREAAYGTLTEDDRKRGHASAGAWLARTGHIEPSVLAEHFRRGGVRDQAITWHLAAARQALEASDAEAVIERARLAIDCGADGEILGQLELLQAEAHNWRNESAAAQRCSQHAMRLLPEGSGEWAHAIHLLVWASAMAGQTEELDALTRSLITHDTATFDDLYLTSMAHAATHLAVSGHLDHACEIDALIADELELVAVPLRVIATVTHMRGCLSYLHAEFDRACDLMLVAADSFHSIGDQRSYIMDLGNAGTARLELGEYAEAAAILATAVEAAERAGLGNLVHTNKANWALALSRSGQAEIALAVCEDALALAANPRHEVITRTYMAQILLDMGQPAEAARSVDRALRVADGLPGLKAFVLGVKASALLALGAPGPAMAAADAGMTILRAMDTIECGEALVRLVYAEALAATDQADRARDAVKEADQRLRTRAERIGDPGRRHSFFTAVPENARTVALAHAWTSPPAAS